MSCRATRCGTHPVSKSAAVLERKTMPTLVSVCRVSPLSPLSCCGVANQIQSGFRRISQQGVVTDAAPPDDMMIKEGSFISTLVACYRASRPICNFRHGQQGEGWFAHYISMNTIVPWTIWPFTLAAKSRRLSSSLM